MARSYSTKIKDEPLLNSTERSWIRGVNLLVSSTQIKPNELADAQDITLIEDGKVQCPRDGQAYYGATSGSRVTGIFNFYKSDGTRKLLRMVGTTLQEYTDATTWTSVSGYTYTTGLNMNAVMAYDRLYACNGTDPLTYYDGSSITSFTERSAPTISNVARTGGSAGSYTYSYKVTAVTASGETTPSTADTETANVDTLTASIYMTISWSAVTGAIGYNVYGRKDGSWYFMAYVEGNSSTSYVDNDADTPNEAFTPPEANTTGGVKGKYIKVYKDSLFIYGDPTNPSRLYYSGGGDKIHDFSIAGGGGFIDVSKNDGQIGTGIEVFKNSILIFKEDSIYQFTFTSTGLPQITQVNPSLGCVAPRSIISVENDVFFMSRRGVFTIGNEAGFAFDVLRTNELSAKVRSTVRNIDGAYIQNVAAIYTADSTKNLVIFAYTPSGSTTNSKAIIYDRERLGWYKWTNIQANCWTNYRGTDGITHYLYGDDASGYCKEILTGSSDFGSAITGYFYLNSESFKALDRYKVLKNIDVVMRRPSGYVGLSVVVDGVETALNVNIGTVSPSVNFGHYVFNRFLFKESYGVGVSSADELVLRTKKNINLESKTFQLRFTNNGTSSFVLLSAGMTAKPRSQNYRHSDDLIQV